MIFWSVDVVCWSVKVGIGRWFSQPCIVHTDGIADRFPMWLGTWPAVRPLMKMGPSFPEATSYKQHSGGQSFEPFKQILILHQGLTGHDRNESKWRRTEPTDGSYCRVLVRSWKAGFLAVYLVSGLNWFN